MIVATTSYPEFTVDKSSLYHFGISGACGFVGDRIISSIQEHKEQFTTGRIIATGTICMVPGLYKEFVMDGYADTGDIFFDALGAYGVPFVLETQKFWLSVKTYRDTKMVSLHGEF